jgi:hypothetical protein
MNNQLFPDERISLTQVNLSPTGEYMFFLNENKIILYQDYKLVEVYIQGIERDITGCFLLSDAIKKNKYIFRHIDNGQVKFILSVYYNGYYSAKVGGDDDRSIVVTGYYNLTDKCVAKYDFSKELITSLDFQATYKDFSVIHKEKAVEKRKKLAQKLKIDYPETQDYTDDEVISYVNSNAPRY